RQAFNMKVLSRYDPHAVSLLQSTSFVVLYTYDEPSSAWSKTSIEGPLFIYSRSSSPTYGLFVLNRNGMDNFIATLGERDEVDCNEGFFIYRPAAEEGQEEEEESSRTYGIWIFEEEQRDTLGQELVRCV
ncbi:PH domain-like protein, partial [Ceraceosorus guamensis]